MTLVPKEALYAMFASWKPTTDEIDIYCDFVMSQSEEFFLNAPVPPYDFLSNRIAEMYGNITRTYSRWMVPYVKSINLENEKTAVALVRRVGIKIPMYYVNIGSLGIFVAADMIDYSFGAFCIYAYSSYNTSVLHGTPMYVISSGNTYNTPLIISHIDCFGFANYAAANGLNDPLVARWLTHRMYLDHPQAKELHLAMSKYFDHADNPRLICRKAKRERDMCTLTEDE